MARLGIHSLLHFLFATLTFNGTRVGSEKAPVVCRDPDLGSHTPANKMNKRKFLIISGAGAGLGNFLIFYPAAYYFAALTGRDIVILEASLIGEMCKVLTCGFPLVSTMKTVYPSIFTESAVQNVRGVKMYDFHRHFSGEGVIEDTIIAAYGYKFNPGWYTGLHRATECLHRLTGCATEDVSCHDRHAFQRLVRGPFKSPFAEDQRARIVGVPENMKTGILTLPHAFAPRLDAAVHLRSQFRHFEYLVGPEDTLWAEAEKEQTEWVHSGEASKGLQLFRAVEQKIMQELHIILAKRKQSQQERHRLLRELRRRLTRRLHIQRQKQQQQYQGRQQHYQQQRLLKSEKQTQRPVSLSQLQGMNSTVRRPLVNSNRDGFLAKRRRQRRLEEEEGETSGAEGQPGEAGEGEAQVVDTLFSVDENGAYVDVAEIERSVAQETYQGDGQSDRVYLYLASDNEAVKEAFARYLVGHAHISVMRVKNDHHIFHAKSLELISRNVTGVMDLALDWYCLSLANVVFAWRRDTDLLSTFAQSAQRVSGNAEELDRIAGTGPQEKEGADRVDAVAEEEMREAGEVEAKMQRAMGYQLFFHNDQPRWREF